MATFMKFLNINTNIIPNPIAGTTTKQGLLFGQRNTEGVLIPAINGFAQPNYYVPFLLPSFPNGQAALNYLTNYGIQSQIGISFTLALPIPTSIIPGTSTTSVNFTPVPANFMQLTDFNLSGTATQNAINAAIFSASINTNTNTATLMVYGTPAFNTTDPITITGINNVPYPDPNNSDPIALMVWDYYQTALSANQSAFGPPATYISILSDLDTSIDPDSTPIELGTASTFPSTVTVNTDGSVTLEYPIATVGLGYLPTTALGNTIVDQDISNATGAFNGFTISGSTVLINVTNVTGTFTTTNTISVTLDNTVNAFNFLNNINLYGAALQFPISTLNDIDVTQASFYNGINQLNQANQVLNQHYFIYGMAGNITSLPSNAANLPAPNSQQYIAPTYPYIAKFGDIPYDNAVGNVASGRVASAVLYMLSNGDPPFPPLISATINHLPVSSIASTTSYSSQAGGTGDMAVIQGWLPLAPNSGNVVQFLQSVTTLITEPNTTTPDTEFRYTHIWDTVRWVKQQVTNLFNVISVLPNNQGTVLISPAFLRQFKAGVLSILNQGQNLGMLQNVPLYSNRVSVTQDTQNPNQVDVLIPIQIIPQLNGANVNIDVLSSTFTFNNSSQGAQ